MTIVKWKESKLSALFVSLLQHAIENYYVVEVQTRF